MFKNAITDKTINHETTYRAFHWFIILVVKTTAATFDCDESLGKWLYDKEVPLTCRRAIVAMIDYSKNALARKHNSFKSDSDLF